MSLGSKKGGKGTHGSLTKAGKVRQVSPKNWGNARKIKKPIKGGTTEVVRWHKRKHLSPLRNNKRRAYLRMTNDEGGLGRKSGQWYGEE